MQYDSSMHDSGWCSDNQTILRPSLLNSVTKRKEKKRKEKKRKEKKRKEKKRKCYEEVLAPFWPPHKCRLQCKKRTCRHLIDWAPVTNDAVN